MKHNYFDGGAGGREEERSLLGGGGGRPGGDGEGGAQGSAEGDVFAMVPGSTMSMFLEVGGHGKTKEEAREKGGREGGCVRLLVMLRSLYR